ncbi:MAG: arsenate reductase ArsC [Casimicrobiaceae bacterium]|nr:arsenate reductase ArsC [Casimicrobiaceae bacterium]MCX8098687.1 arsenate reductase ArsC [Casimicrobiaceae bacterium]MDW8311836.1 arsenate reductase ArsC [Burkholderiales bacterium]
MAAPPYNVLILCTGNSARSIMAEGLINVLGRGRFRAWSAGSRPTGVVNPFAIEQLATIGYPRPGDPPLRSKSWDEFARPDAPVMDFVFTVCDNAAGEVCPVWPGNPVTAHWGFSDPAAVEGDEAAKRHAFTIAFNQIRHRVQLFVSLPLESLDRLAIQREVQAIGRPETLSA